MTVSKFYGEFGWETKGEPTEDARIRIKDHGVFLCGSFFDINLEKDFFDCTISLHTIYHIDKNRQEEAVRKLIEVTKPGKPIIIIYSNPHTLLSYLVYLKIQLQKILKNMIYIFMLIRLNGGIDFQI